MSHYIIVLVFSRILQFWSGSYSWAVSESCYGAATEA